MNTDLETQLTEVLHSEAQRLMPDQPPPAWTPQPAVRSAVRWRPAVLIAAAVAVLVAGITVAVRIDHRSGPAVPPAPTPPATQSWVVNGTSTTCPADDGTAMTVTGVEILDQRDNATFTLFPAEEPTVCVRSPRMSSALRSAATEQHPITLQVSGGAQPYLWGTVQRSAKRMSVAVDDGSPVTYDVVTGARDYATTSKPVGPGWDTAAGFAGGLPAGAERIRIQALDQQGTAMQTIEIDLANNLIVDDNTARIDGIVIPLRDRWTARATGRFDGGRGFCLGPATASIAALGNQGTCDGVEMKLADTAADGTATPVPGGFSSDCAKGTATVPVLDSATVGGRQGQKVTISCMHGEQAGATQSTWWSTADQTLTFQSRWGGQYLDQAEEIAAKTDLTGWQHRPGAPAASSAAESVHARSTTDASPSAGTMRVTAPEGSVVLPGPEQNGANSYCFQPEGDSACSAVLVLVGSPQDDGTRRAIDLRPASMEPDCATTKTGTTEETSISGRPAKKYTFTCSKDGNAVTSWWLTDHTVAVLTLDPNQAALAEKVAAGIELQNWPTAPSPTSSAQPSTVVTTATATS